jgi:hypothetical protein
MKKVLLATIALALVNVQPAAAFEVSWRTIVGIEQPGNIVGSFSSPPTCPMNGNGCINGASQPWSSIPLAEPQVTIDTVTGTLSFKVKGLVVAGGNDVGDVPAALTSIIVTLMCIIPPAGPNIIIGRKLSINRLGDSAFSGKLDGAVPSSCVPSNMHLLIQANNTAGPWIANGASRTVNTP